MLLALFENTALLLINYMAEDNNGVELRSSEVPLCYGSLARFGNLVVGADCLPEKLARFGCRADCDNCVVAEAVNRGTEFVGDSLDLVATSIVRAVRTLQSAGNNLVG